jgi:hypothetical protein
MSTHNYTRKNAGGGYANPGMGDPDLPTLVETALPGKTFVIRCNGAALNIVFDATLTAGEVTTLDAQYTSWTPVVPAPVPTAAPQPNYMATVAPTVTDDEDAGYSFGSCWVNTTTDKAYICTDPSIGAAVWKDQTTVAGVIGTWQGAWVTATVYAVDDAVENGGGSFICISAHTSGATDEPDVGASWETKWDLVAAKGAPATPVEVSATDMVSTTGSSYILLPGMTGTPAAGTYKFTFSSTGETVNKNQVAWYAIFKDGVIVQHTERRASVNGNQNIDSHLTLHTQAVLAVTGSEVVEVRYKSSGNNAFSVFDRSLIRGS